MNKQELIKKYVYMKRNLEMWVCIPDILEDLKQLDEPQKVTVPQFVADWIEKVGGELFGLNYDSVPSEIYDWVYEEEGNLKKLHLACAIGYEVEREPKYTVKIKAYLGQYLGRYYINNEELTPRFTTSQLTGKGELPTFTSKELRKHGFGWVFNCPGIEVKEVKE